MVEKLASSEIAQSRERFEKWVTAMEPAYADQNLERMTGGRGSYRVHNVHCWWMGWKEGWERAIAESQAHADPNDPSTWPEIGKSPKEPPDVPDDAELGDGEPSPPPDTDTVDSHKLGFCCRYACNETCVGCGDATNGEKLPEFREESTLLERVVRLNKLATRLQPDQTIPYVDVETMGCLTAFFLANFKTVCKLESGAAQEVSPAISEKCGQPAAPFIPRWGMSFACVLPKGHEGEHKQGGTCFKHGEYVGSQCPQWPNCAQEVSPPSPELNLPNDTPYPLADEYVGGDTRELKAAANKLIDYCIDHDWGMMPEPYDSINPLLKLLGRFTERSGG